MCLLEKQSQKCFFNPEFAEEASSEDKLPFEFTNTRYKNHRTKITETVPEQTVMFRSVFKTLLYLCDAKEAPISNMWKVVNALNSEEN